MRNYTITITMLLISILGYAQEAISTQGETYSSANVKLDFTIGEVVTKTGSDGSNDLTQGFHQTNWSLVSIEDEDPEFKVSVFPNPMENYLFLELSDYDGVRYTFYTETGQVIKEKTVSSNMSSLSVGDLAPGIYFIQISRNNQKIKVIKLVKTK